MFHTQRSGGIGGPTFELQREISIHISHPQPHSPPHNMNNTHNSKQLIKKEAMASLAFRHIINIAYASHLKSSPSVFVKPKPYTFITSTNIVQCLNPTVFSRKYNLVAVCKASSANSISPVDDEDGVSLGTMKLPSNTDVARFETLLFQVMHVPKCHFRMKYILVFCYTVTIMCRATKNIDFKKYWLLGLVDGDVYLRKV